MDKVTPEIINSIMDEIELKAKLQNLSDKELVVKAIEEYTDFTWHPVVEIMMDRLYPGWEERNS